MLLCPVSFSKTVLRSVCCCIIGFSDPLLESSTGVQTACRMCCYQHSAALFRPKDDKCYCAYGRVGLTAPSASAMDCYLQLCPVHLFMCHARDRLGDLDNVPLERATGGGAAESNKAVPCA